MKRIFIVCVLALLVINSVYAAQRQKVYFRQEAIDLKQNQIFVSWDDQWVPVRKLQSDSEGYYSIWSNDQESDLPLGFWVCQNGHVNPPWRLACQICGSI